MVAVHCCLAVNCVGIHWLQQNRTPLSAAIVMGQTAYFVAAGWPVNTLHVDHTTSLSQAFSILARLICKQASAMHSDQHLRFLPTVREMS